MAKKTFDKLSDITSNLDLNKKLNLDERDNNIMFLIQENPKISQEDIAKKIKLSQPSVGARIRKLQEKGIYAMSMVLISKKLIYI